MQQEGLQAVIVEKEKEEEEEEEEEDDHVIDDVVFDEAEPDNGETRPMEEEEEEEEDLSSFEEPVLTLEQDLAAFKRRINVIFSPFTTLACANSVWCAAVHDTTGTPKHCSIYAHGIEGPYGTCSPVMLMVMYGMRRFYGKIDREWAQCYKRMLLDKRMYVPTGGEIAEEDTLKLVEDLPQLTGNSNLCWFFAQQRGCKIHCIGSSLSSEEFPVYFFLRATLDSIKYINDGGNPAIDTGKLMHQHVCFQTTETARNFIVTEWIGMK